MRLIDADALDYELGISDRDIYVRECLHDAPTVQIEPHWISVKEQLPDRKNKSYWICTDTGYQCQCRWTNNIYGLGTIGDMWGWKVIDIPQYTYVIAWRELPEPYKGETE